MVGAYVAKGVMHGRGMCFRGMCMAEGDGVHGRGCAWQRGACLAGGCGCMAGEMAIAANGIHPTRMHTCFACFSN